MTSFGKFTLRFAAYGCVFLYLACDLFLFHGPLYKRLQADKPDSAESIADAKRRGVAAVVYGREITLAQIDHAVRNRLSQEGVSNAALMPVGTLRLHRYAALAELIDHELLRVKAMHSSSELPVGPSDVDAAYARILARFPDTSAFADALAASGENPATFRARLAARIQQTKYVESRVAPTIPPEASLARDEFIREFRETLRRFESHRDRIRIRREILERPFNPEADSPATDP